MRINDIIKHQLQSCNDMIKERCGEFLYQSGGLPLLKNLPSTYQDFHKVKVRKRSIQQSEIVETFNQTFQHEIKQLRQRAVFVNGDNYTVNKTDNEEPFYIFPIDGFKFIYNPEVQNSSHEYKTAFSEILQHLGENKGHQVLQDLLKMTYSSSTLNEAIQSTAEIIIYNIPYFYAVRATAQPYNQIIP